MDNDLVATIVIVVPVALAIIVAALLLERAGAAARQAKLRRGFEANRRNPHHWRNER